MITIVLPDWFTWLLVGLVVVQGIKCIGELYVSWLRYKLNQIERQVKGDQHG